MSKIKHRSVVQFDNDLVASGSAFFYGNTDMEGSLHVGGAASFSGPSDTFVTFNASDTTPSVSAGNLFKTHASSQTLTMFDDGAAGQTIVVISTAAVVFDVTGTNLKGGNTNITTAAGDITTWTFDGTYWYLQQFMDVDDDMSSASGGATINNATESRLLTVASDTSEMDAEANLTYDGTTFTVNDNMVVGSDGSGHDVTFYSATSGDHLVWDASEEKLTITGTDSTTALDIADGNVTITDDLSVDGTTNLDNTDIDGTFAVDGTTISLDATTSLNIDNSNTSNGITIGTATSGVPISIGHTNSVVTINDEVDITGTVDINDTTDASNSTSGALKVDGGVGVAKKLYVGTDLDVDGTANLDNTDIDGTLVVDGSNISLDSTSTFNIDCSNTSNGISIGTATSGVPISIGHSTSETTINDNLTVTGDLTVNGTTTTINSTTLTVDDLNIVLASGAADSSAADGAGITIDGAGASLIYDHTGTQWEFNKPLEVADALYITKDTDAEFVALTLTNQSDAASTAGYVSILFNLEDTSGNAVDSGKIAVKKEASFTSTGGTQDSSMVFSTSLDGTLTEQMKLDSSGDLSLLTDSSIFKMGAGSDFTITHDGTTGVTLAANPINITAGGASTWKTTAGAITIDAEASTVTMDGHSGVTITTSNSGEIDITSAANVDINATTGVTIDGTTLSIDGTDDSNITVTASGKDLDIAVAGGSTQELRLASAGTGASAMHLNASAGGINIDSADMIDIDAADEITIDTTSADGHIAITSAHTAGQSILISANADAGAILDIDAGIIDIDVQDTITIDGTGVSIDGTDDSNITVTASGKDLDIAVAGGSTQELRLASAGTGASAMHLNASAGGIDIDSADMIDIDAADEITIDTTSADGHIAVTSAHTAGQSILISANADAGSILDIDAGIIDIDVQDAITIDAADEIVVTTTSADGHISLVSAHTSGVAFHIDANADAASEVQIDAGILDIDVTAGITIDGTTLSIDSTDTTNITMTANAASTKTFTISATNSNGSNVSNIDVDADGALTLNGAGGATFGDDTEAIVYDGSGNLDVDAVALDLDVTDSSSITITSSEAAEDLTIQQVGGNDSSIIITAAGTGADAISIDATAGSMVIGASLVDQKTLTLGNTNSTYIQLIPHDTAASEKILIYNNAGTADDAIKIHSDAGGVTIKADDDSIHIDADGTDADALNIDSAGGIDIDSDDMITIDAADEITITTTSADGHISLVTAHTAGTALHIDADADAGSIVDIDAGILDIDVTGNATIDAATLTVTTDTATFTSANADDPLVTIKNTTNDATGARLRFEKDRGSNNGADGDDCGIIEFYGTDGGSNQTEFARIVAEVSEADNTDEAGKLSLMVAESDGTDTAVTAGLVLEGEHATDGQVDVTIAAGVASTTTVAGDLTISGGDTTIGTAGNTTATTISVITNTGTSAGKDLTISAGSSTTNGNNINGGNLILKAGGGDGTGTSAMTFFTKVNGTDSAAERMRIHTDGNVGIGTNAPGCNLHVAGNDVRIRADGNSNSHPGFELSENGTRKWIIFNNYGNDNLDFKTDSDIRMSIEQGGNVGIGNTNPGSLLEVSKTAANSEATRPTIEISSFSDADDASTSAGVLKFHKSANDTINSYGAGSHTAAGEVIGRIEAWGVTNDDDGSSDAAKLSSYIEFAGDAVADETDVPGKIVFATADADDNGAPTVRLTIDDGGGATFTGVLDVDGTVDCDVTDFDVASSGDIDLVSTNNAASAIHIEENGGTSGTIKIYANQGNTDGSAGAGSILLASDDGGIGLSWNDAKDLWAEGGKFIVTANEDAAGCIKLHADAGSNQTIQIINDEGTETGAENEGAILLNATVGGIGLHGADDKIIWAEAGQIILTANQNTSESIKLHADAGANQTIQIINDAGTTDGSEGAGAIDIEATVGGISLHAADDKDIWIEGGQTVITANHDTADSIKLHADAGSSQTITLVNDAGTSATEGSAAIQLLASAGGINIKSNLDNADAILLTSDGGTSAKINIHNDQGTAADSINLLSDDGGVTVDAALNVTVDCPKISQVHELTTNPLSIASYDTDGEGGGTILKYNPGTDPTTTLGGIYYLHTNGVWTAADADAVSSGASQLLGIAMGTSPRTHGMLTKGIVRIPSTEILNVPGSNASPGLPVYVSTTAGHLDFTAPTGTSDYVRVVGYALQDNGSDVLIYFDPDPTWVELT